jgi:ATP-dependent Clp protease ATP-binding subunit ClpC
MFERFKEGARFAIVTAQNEASALHHDYTGTEHVLLGLVQREGVAATALSSMGVTTRDAWR